MKLSALDVLTDERIEQAIAIIIIGRDGRETVWVSDRIETPEQFEWLRKKIESASITSIIMRDDQKVQ